MTVQHSCASGTIAPGGPGPCTAVSSPHVTKHKRAPHTGMCVGCCLLDAAHAESIYCTCPEPVPCALEEKEIELQLVSGAHSLGITFWDVELSTGLPLSAHPLPLLWYHLCCCRDSAAAIAVPSHVEKMVFSQLRNFHVGQVQANTRDVVGCNRIRSMFPSAAVA